MLNVRACEGRVRGEFHLDSGIAAVVGLSGSGKTSLFRLISGLDAHPKADVSVNQESMTSRPPYERPIAYVPQRPSLIPHKTVEAQVRWVQRVPDDTIAEWRDVLNLARLWTQSPRHLSGGEQQRAALLRALASDREILLLDEALGNVDRPHRQHIWDYLATRWPANRLLMFTTHEWEEAEWFADRILYLERGVLYPVQRPSEMRPLTAQMARLMGFVGILRTPHGEPLLAHPRIIRPGLEPEVGVAIPGHLAVSPLGPLMSRYRFVSSDGQVLLWIGAPGARPSYPGITMMEAMRATFDWEATS